MSTLSQLNERTKFSNEQIENGIAISVLSSNVKNYIREIKFKKYHKHKRKNFCFLCRSQTNSLLLILSAYIVIFLIASVILILSVLKLQDLNENEISKNSFETSEHLLRFRYNSVLRAMDDTFSKVMFKEFMWPYRNSLFNCSNLREVKNFTYLMSGWTKNVFTFMYNGKQYALKTVNSEGIDMKKCMEKHTDKLCFDKASSKLYKEYILSRELSHSNIVKVLAWCVSSSNYSDHVAIVSELCTPIDLIFLLRLSFHQRLKIVVDLSNLMAYLAESPLGSVAINDFQRQQFVMCGNTLKLTDLDDLSIEEPRCLEHKHCFHKKLADLHVYNKHSEELQLKCIDNFCIGYNEKQNLINTYMHFVNLFLNITTPDILREDIEALLQSYTSVLSAKSVLKQTEQLFKWPHCIFTFELFHFCVPCEKICLLGVFLFFTMSPAAIAGKTVNLGKQALQAAKPHAEKFLYYAKVELAPPKLSEIPAAVGAFGNLIKSFKSKSWKQLTVKQAFLNTLVATEVWCWFYIGECIGKGRIVGYKV